MIVASIPITFKSGRAADLLGHMTETGREYEFVPDITLPEGCSAAIEIVKPDGMFVIAECSIVDGNIIVTLPAQALVVRGLAHYIIRITTADDKIIFSAAGSIWVDDALITNEMLESISEVYGLTFPDDFLTTADLANYVTIDDLRAALSDYALKTDIIDVAANPSGAAAADLAKIKIGSEIYKIPDAAVTKTASGNPIEISDGANAPLVKCVNAITGYQQGSGTPSPSNIRPIVAYTEGEIKVMGKNIWDEQWEVGSLDASGEPISNTNTIRSKNFTPCQGNTNYYLNYSLSTDDIRICFYDENHTFISRTRWLYKESFQTPTTARYLKLLTSTVYGSTYRNDIIIAIGSQAVDYEPYTSTTHTTTYPSAIYRGSEDVVNGTATTEWGMIASYAGETLQGEWISDRDEYAPGTTPTTGAQVAYALATPTTEPVTPTNLPVKSLNGYSHIESTTGEMEIEYITQMYQPIIDLIS